MAKEVKTNAIRFLEKNKMDFEFIAYDSDGFMDGVSVARKLGQPLELTYKTLVAQGKSRNYYVYVIPVDKGLDLKKAARAVGEKSVEMLPVKDLTAVTGYVRGGCSPIGMKKKFVTVLDDSAAGREYIMFSGGRLGLQIKMNPEKLIELIGGSIEDICADGEEHDNTIFEN